MSAWRHPNESAHHGRCGYANVRTRFTVDQMAEHVEAVYGEAAGQRVSGRGHTPYPKFGVKVAGPVPERRAARPC
jgi:hypothetical protein